MVGLGAKPGGAGPWRWRTIAAVAHDSIPPLDLPAGLIARPLRRTDAEAITDLIGTCEVHDVGEWLIELADIIADWDRPAFDLATSSVGVWEGGHLVAYAEVFKTRFADCHVHPDYRGRGLGEALATWMVALSRRDGGTLVGMPVPSGSYGERVLRAAGWEPLWTSWVLGIPEGEQIRPQPIPTGFHIRAAGPQEYRAAYEVQEGAFLEWSDRARESYEEWVPSVVGRLGFEDWNLRVAVDPDGEVVGVAFVTVFEGCGFVGRLAVRQDQRGQGLARALLVDAFGVAREHGGARAELSTDSRTGALSLYEKVGMVVTSTWFHLARPVA